jgi:3-oxoadipate CoA-transferase, beta subunit
MTARRTREQMAAALARDIPDGSYVNLGIGMPIAVLRHWRPEQEIVVHSENGILGMRERLRPPVLFPPGPDGGAPHA